MHCSVVHDASACAKCPCPSRTPATGPNGFLYPPSLDESIFCPQSNPPGWLAGCSPVGARSRFQYRPGIPPPHGPIASMAVHKNSWAELGTLNWLPLSACLPCPTCQLPPAPLPGSPSSLPVPASASARRPPHARSVLKLPTQVSLTKNPAWQSFACENPLWASLASWPPDQPAKLQSKATDLHESSRMGSSRMVDLDCNLSRSVPEFFFSFFSGGELG